jgi:putative membrane protein
MASIAQSGSSRAIGGRDLLTLLPGAFYLAAIIGFAWATSPLAQALAASSILVAFIHAARAYGWKNALMLFVICSVITFTIENIGSTTGYPFGHYHFEVAPELPHIGVIPIIVGPLWFGMGYFSWVVAGIILDGADQRVDEHHNDIILPIVAAFIMTQWDLVMDAPGATLSKAWVWHSGGAYFGVPISNYFGWLLTSWVFFQAFALYLRTQPSALAQSRRMSRRSRLFAILIYAAAGLTHVTPWLLGQSGIATDATGQTWRVGDVREATVAVMIFTMLFTSLLASIRLFRSGREPSAEAIKPSGSNPQADHDFAPKALLRAAGQDRCLCGPLLRRVAGKYHVVIEG